MAEADNWPFLCGQGVSRPAGKGGPGTTGLRGQCVLRSAEGQDTLWGKLSYIISLCALACKCAFMVSCVFLNKLPIYVPRNRLFYLTCSV